MTNARSLPLDETTPAGTDSHGVALSGLGQIVLVLQGGGALGAYQVGVYQALHTLLCRRRNCILCRLKRTASCAGIIRWLVAHF